MTLRDARNAALASTGRLALRLGEGGQAGEQGWRMPRRHVLMLVLAVELLAFGFGNADRYRRPPVATVDPPSIAGHVIT